MLGKVHSRNQSNDEHTKVNGRIMGLLILGPWSFSTLQLIHDKIRMYYVQVHSERDVQKGYDEQW